MSDLALVEELIAKLREMEEQCSMAQLETTGQSVLAARIRHLGILATYLRSRLETMAGKSASQPPKSDPDQTIPDRAKPI